MFEILGSESEHEAAVKRTINLQEEIMENYENILVCQTEIKRYEEEIAGLNNALKHWKKELEKYYSISGCTNLVAEITKEKKPKTK